MNWFVRHIPVMGCIAMTAALVAAPAAASEDYILDVEFFPDSANLNGEAIIALDDERLGNGVITFYLHGELGADAVQINGMDAEFTQGPVYYDYDYSLIAQKVDIKMPEALQPGDGGLTLSIDYSGPFHASRARSPSDYMRIDSDGVFLRAYGYSLWFPIFLEAGKDGEAVNFERVSLRAPDEFFPVFAGELVSEKKTDGKRTTVWKALDLPIYAAQVTARPYQAMQSDFVDIYTLKDEKSLAGAGKIADYAKDVISEYLKLYGEPRTKSKTIVAQLPRYGDIASGNMIGIADHIWREFDSSAWYGQTIAHELVHDFVYVLTPTDDPFFAMVREGFPAYFHLPAFAKLYGETFYNDYLDRIENGYIIKLETGKNWRGNEIPPNKALVEIRSGEIGHYKDTFVLGDRSSLFLDFLRRKMGSENFEFFFRELIQGRRITLAEFYALLGSERPDLVDDARVWLETTDFPDRFKRSAD